MAPTGRGSQPLQQDPRSGPGAVSVLLGVSDSTLQPPLPAWSPSQPASLWNGHKASVHTRNDRSFGPSLQNYALELKKCTRVHTRALAGAHLSRVSCFPSSSLSCQQVCVAHAGSSLP